MARVASGGEYGGQFKGLPEGWRNVYTSGHGFSGRHVYNPDLDLAISVKDAQKVARGDIGYPEMLNKYLGNVERDLEPTKTYVERGSYEFHSLKALIAWAKINITVNESFWVYFVGRMVEYYEEEEEERHKAYRTIVGTTEGREVGNLENLVHQDVLSKIAPDGRNRFVLVINQTKRAVA